MKIAFAGATDLGLKRTVNEDGFLVDEGWSLCAVADGAGGIESGETASKEGLAALTETLEGLRAQLRFAGPSVLGRMIVRAVEEANRRVIARAAADPILKGAGTTMTAALFGAGRAFLAHVGDGRAYLLRAGELTQLTEDHTLVNEMIRAGKMTREEAETHHFKGIITRVLGYQDPIDVDAVQLALAADDRLLLCTDGLWRWMPEEELAPILAAGTPEDAARALIARANQGGGGDNIAVAVASVIDP